MSRQSKTRVNRFFHRNGILETEQTFRGQKLHGRHRTWHRNGQIATEEYYLDGLLHGVVNQWHEDGRLLGSFEMQHGTGIQKTWHDNGKPKQEFGTAGGKFYGRNRYWLRDGMLISDEILLDGRPVSASTYRQAAAKDSRLPKLIGSTPVKSPSKTRALEKHIFGVFVSGLLKKHIQVEAREWLKSSGKTTRSLGRFKSIRSALKFVEELYQAGAVQVIAPDVYEGKHGSQFSDNLLVQLPKSASQRKAILTVCLQLEKKNVAAVEPSQDLGQTYIFILLA
jgi:hypothetical protein